MAMRIYLAGRMKIKGDTALVDESHLPGRQGRLALAMPAPGEGPALAGAFSLRVRSSGR